jgi:D-alanyl-D-alanine carboxypeptidase
VGAALVLVVPQARAQTASQPALPGPKASILVDADTGAILSGVNVHQPLRPASLTKIVTALTAVENLPPGTQVPVSARTEGMPAHNMNMKQGQVWPLEDVLAALLVSSANDAGMALAERVSGSAEAFGAALEATARRLGMSDGPTLRDPSGLDDEFSVEGGNEISARDLAIAARAVLAEPRLAPIVATKVYSFTGPDGVAHRLGNHNRLLKLYDGAIGMKTGYTRRAMHGLVAAATRGGRTMITVILGAPGSTYEPTAALLDYGFSVPVSAETGAEHLPARPRPANPGPVADVAPATAQKGGTAAIAAVGANATSRKSTASAFGFLLKFFLFSLACVAVLRTRVLLRAKRRKDPGWPHLKVPPVKLPQVKLNLPRPRAPIVDILRLHLKRVRLPHVSLPKPRLPKVKLPVIDLRSQGAHKAHHASPALPAKRAMSSPAHARPRPTRARPAHRRAATPKQTYEPVPLTEIDPKLAQRFEILARTGQVTK